MKSFRACLILLLGMAVTLCAAAQAGPRPAAEGELFALANQSRAQLGAAPLRWDRALAEAAMRHCERMVQEGPISHRYGGEADLTERAAATGAHFSLIEENIAAGSYAAQLHEGWMNSPGHRRNLLNPDVDRVGIAVIQTRGVMYAVADYARGVQALSPPQVEAKVGDLLRNSGIMVHQDSGQAQAACRLDSGLPPLVGSSPQFVMRWQGADLDHLPQDLVAQVNSGRYRSAVVGSCPPRGETGGFTAYRLAVLLY
jgi:Cysteine-rich secretory protein family